jgi:NADH-quinone oxidoreductase subunit N
MLSAISMVVGNVIAISQQNVKRMLAYSSIAHAGYILSGIAAANEIGKIGVLFYLTAYTFMNLGAFTIVALMEAEEDKKLTFDDYSGLSKSHPVLAALTTLFMFALTGIPPFAGFVGKYYVFLSAVKAEMVWLAVVGVLASLVSAYYYLRLVVIMYFKEGVSSPSSKRNIGVVLALFITAFFVFQLGVYPSVILDLAGSLF